MTDDRLSSLLNWSTFSGAVMAGAGALSLAQWLAIGGFLLALAGFAVNLWHKIQMVRLRKRELRLQEQQAAS